MLTVVVYISKTYFYQVECIKYNYRDVYIVHVYIISIFQQICMTTSFFSNKIHFFFYIL